jgi:hypothetical protein
MGRRSGTREPLKARRQSSGWSQVHRRLSNGPGRAPGGWLSIGTARQGRVGVSGTQMVLRRLRDGGNWLVFGVGVVLATSPLWGQLVFGVNPRLDQLLRDRVPSPLGRLHEATSSRHFFGTGPTLRHPARAALGSRACRTASAGVGVPAASSSVPSGAAAGSRTSTLSPVRPRSISSRSCARARLPAARTVGRCQLVIELPDKGRWQRRAPVAG